MLTAIAIMNSATIPHGQSGLYEYRIINKDTFIKILKDAIKERVEVDSYVGYKETRDHIRKISGVVVSINRDQKIDLSRYDFALVCRLKYRVMDPKMKKYWQPSQDDWEYGIFKFIGRL